MAIHATKVKVGAANVTFKGSDLGSTKGGITCEISTQTEEITVDQAGDTPLFETILGRRATVTVPLAETDFQLLSTILGDVTYSNDTVTIGTGLGENVLNYSGVLEVTSMTDGSIFRLLKAAPILNFRTVYEPRGIRIYPITFKGYLEEGVGIVQLVAGS